MEGRLFQDVLERTQADFPEDGRAICLGCHAPLASQTADEKVIQEGVTCDYCHSVRRVDFDGPNPKAVLAFSKDRAGPKGEAAGMPHNGTAMPLHGSAEVCAPCHEHRNGFGFPVLTTYSEWKNSRYAKEGRTCQSCHMARVPGNIADARGTQSGTGTINVHEMAGSHSVERLAQAITARISSARQGAGLRVTVEIGNQTAGHYLPTGSPLRQLVMELQADSAGGRHFAEQRLYARQVADHHGTVLMREHFAFLNADRQVSDTRLAPGETRAESFLFPIPEGDPAQLKATLWYYYSPLAKTDSQMRVEFLTVNGAAQ
jgi:RNase P subunit RPR2